MSSHPDGVNWPFVGFIVPLQDRQLVSSVFFSRKREPPSKRFLSSPRHSPNLCPLNVRTFRLGLPRSNCNSLFIHSACEVRGGEVTLFGQERGQKCGINRMVSADCLGYCLACKSGFESGTTLFGRSWNEEKDWLVDISFSVLLVEKHIILVRVSFVKS